MADSLPYFIEPFHGWVIRIGPDAYKRPDPYIWRVLISDDGRWLMELNGELLVPLSPDGEFQAVSTQPLTPSVVRTAIKAAQSLGFDSSRWLHKEKITMAHDHKHAKHNDKDAAGKVTDQVSAQNNVAAYLEAMKAGKVQLLAVGPPLAVPGLEGVVAKMFILKE